MSLKEIFKLVLGWRLLIVLIALPAMFLLSPRTRLTNLTEKPSVSNIFSMWSNFDGLHYLNLAQYGYGYQHKTAMDYAFFPVYPWAIHTFNVFGNYLASGLFLSHLFLILALYFLYKLVLLDFKPKIAKSTIYLILLFPTAFFFGSVYTESLFLMLIVMSFYFVRMRQFFLACILAAIASATRVTGILLWPAILYEFWIFSDRDLKKVFSPGALWFILPPLGLISFMRFQLVKTGDALMFLNFQNNFVDRTMEKLVLLHQIFYRYLMMVIYTDHTDPLFFTVFLELFSATLVIFVLVLAFKGIRFSYWLFAFLSFILPTLTGTFIGMPRFTVVLFPIFIFLAQFFDKQHPYFRYFYFAVCAVLSVFAVTFFTRGYFVG